MFCSITVLPVRGGETISARWPLPSGVIRSMTRVVRSFLVGSSSSSFSRSLGIERRQIVEIDAVADLVRLVEIDRVDLEQGEIALAVLGRADLALDRVAGAQAEAAHLARAHIDVVRARQVVRFRRAQEAEAVLQDLEHAVAEDGGVVLRQAASGSRTSCPAGAGCWRSRSAALRRKPAGRRGICVSVPGGSWRSERGGEGREDSAVRWREAGPRTSRGRPPRLGCRSTATTSARQRTADLMHYRRASRLVK